jgi:hypothetical protein
LPRSTICSRQIESRVGGNTKAFSIDFLSILTLLPVENVEIAIAQPLYFQSASASVFTLH